MNAGKVGHVMYAGKATLRAPLTLSHSHNEPARAFDVHGVASCSIRVCKCRDLLQIKRLELNEQVLRAPLR